MSNILLGYQGSDQQQKEKKKKKEKEENQFAPIPEQLA